MGAGKVGGYLYRYWMKGGDGDWGWCGRVGWLVVLGDGGAGRWCMS